MDLLKVWWEYEKVSGNAGFVLQTKFKKLKAKIKNRVNDNLGKIEHKINLLVGILTDLECEEEEYFLLDLELVENIGRTWSCGVPS